MLDFLFFVFLTFLDLTDVCPLLTKQYIQFGLQIQYMLENFQMVSLRIHGTIKSFGYSTYGLQHLSTIAIKSIDH
jgi:hypothetical protein